MEENENNFTYYFTKLVRYLIIFTILGFIFLLTLETNYFKKTVELYQFQKGTIDNLQADYYKNDISKLKGIVEGNIFDSLNEKQILSLIYQIEKIYYIDEPECENKNQIPIPLKSDLKNLLLKLYNRFPNHFECNSYDINLCASLYSEIAFKKGIRVPVDFKSINSLKCYTEKLTFKTLQKRGLEKYKNSIIPVHLKLSKEKRFGSFINNIHLKEVINLEFNQYFENIIQIIFIDSELFEYYSSKKLFIRKLLLNGNIEQFNYLLNTLENHNKRATNQFIHLFTSFDYRVLTPIMHPQKKIDELKTWVPVKKLDAFNKILLKRYPKRFVHNRIKK